MTEEIVALLKTYRCAVVVGHNYAAKWVSQAFVKAGAMYRKSQINRSEIYLSVLPLFTSGRARLIDNARLITQFAGLERRTFSTGRDRVDHGRAGHDDLCNAAAGALELASRPAPQQVKFVEAFVAGQPRNIPGGSVFAGNPYAARSSNAPPAHYLKQREPWEAYMAAHYDRWRNYG